MTGALVTPLQARALCLLAGAARGGHPLSLSELGHLMNIGRNAEDLVRVLRQRGLCATEPERQRTARPAVEAVVCCPSQCPRCQREVFLDWCHACRVRTLAKSPASGRRVA